MRFLVSGLSSDKLAGIETFLLNMDKFMAKDVTFDYVVEGSDCIHEPAIRQMGGHVRYITPKRQMLKNLRDWRRLLRENRGVVDGVYFNLYSFAWLPPILLAKRYGYRVIIHAHNNNLHDCGFAQKAMHTVNRYLQKFMKLTRLTNSAQSTRFFFGNTPAQMIYCAIDPQRFAFRPEARQSIRSALGIGDEQHIYGFVGRIAYQKNPLFLMDVFREIAMLDSKAVFLVLGDGELIDETHRRAQEYGLSIHFLGSRTNIEDYYCAMDEFVFPSYFEGLGIVLVEAQASGLVCIASARVIPQDVKVTDLVHFVPLEEGAAHWAHQAVEALNAERQDRQSYASIVGATAFNIVTEAERLRRCLCACE